MSVECKFCGGYFPSPNELIEHQRNWHENGEKGILPTPRTAPGTITTKDFERKELPKTKICSECGESKQFSSFNKNGTTKDGYLDWCISCAIKMKKEIEKKFVCKICGKECESLAHLGGHTVGKHTVHKKNEPKTSKKCPYCGGKCWGRHVEFCKSRPSEKKESDGFIRSKMVNGNGPYYEQVKSEWIPGKGSRQKVVQYLGKENLEEPIITQAITPTITIEQKIAPQPIKKENGHSVFFCPTCNTSWICNNPELPKCPGGCQSSLFKNVRIKRFSVEEVWGL